MGKRMHLLVFVMLLCGRRVYDTYLYPHGKCSYNYNYLYVLSKFIKEGINGKGYEATTS